jgi:hypothetical protein
MKKSGVRRESQSKYNLVGADVLSAGRKPNMRVVDMIDSRGRERTKSAGFNAGLKLSLNRRLHLGHLGISVHEGNHSSSAAELACHL